MSDIVNLRLDSHYIHPKKSTWRGNSKSNTDTNISTKEEDNPFPVIKERVDMVVCSNFINKNGISQAVEEPSPTLNVSQEAPLDFSVKTVINSELGHVPDLDTSHSEASTPRDFNIPKPDYEMHSTFSNTISTPVSEHSGKVSSSTVPIYNGSSKCQRPKQRHVNGSSPSTDVNSETLRSLLKLQNACGILLPMQDSYMMHNNSVQQAHFPISNKRLREASLNQDEETSFEGNGLNSTMQSPMSRESSPDNNQYKGSILHNVLAGIPGERSQAHGHSSYIQKNNPSATCTQPSSSPQLIGINSTFSPPNLMMPDTSSLLPTAGTRMPGSNPLIPAAGYSLFNGLGFPPTAINGINAFFNGNMLPHSSLDTRMLQTPNSGDKKPSKHIRPFKAITSDLLYGMSPMGHPGMSAVISNGGYFIDYTQASTKNNIDPTKSSPASRRESPESLANSAKNSSPPICNNATDHKLDAAGSGDSNCSYPVASGSIEKAESTTNRKSNRTLPDELKDDAYWERRRKNNQAAKRSRDSRRMKEDVVAQQAWMFREQNIQMQYQMTSQDEKMQHMQSQLMSCSDRIRTLELQLRLEKEQLRLEKEQHRLLKDKSCRKCGSRNESDISENNYDESIKNNGHCP